MLKWIIVYLIVSLCGWAAAIELKRMPIWKMHLPGDVTVTPGDDVTLCECLVVAAISLVPIINIVFNILWFFIAWDYWRKGRPFGKCPVVFKGRSAR